MSLGMIISRASHTVVKYAPQILIGVGIGAGVGATVTAFRAYPKVDEVLGSWKSQVKVIKEEKNNLTKNEYHANQFRVVKDHIGKLAVAVAPPVLLTAVSVTSILAGVGILNTRNAGLATALAGVQKSYNRYREEVRKEYGKEADRTILERSVAQQYQDYSRTFTEGDETFTETNIIQNEYARWFDDSSIHYSNNAQQNLAFLVLTQRAMNDRLKYDGVVLLNDVYEALGIPRTAVGAIVGWTNDGGDGFIDFGIFEEDASQKKRDFVNGYEKSVLLDFNVEGSVYQYLR